MERNINLDESEIEELSMEVANYLRPFSGEDGQKEVAHKMMKTHFGLEEKEDRDAVLEKVDEIEGL